MQDDDSRPVTIYALVEPRTGAVRYIGQTRRTLEWRLALHMNARTGKARAAWIDELRAQGVRPLIVGLEVTDQGEADEAEARHIAEHRARGCALTNAQSAPRRRRTDGTRKRGRPKTTNGNMKVPQRAPIAAMEKRTVGRPPAGHKLEWTTVVRLAKDMGADVDALAARERRPRAVMARFLIEEALAARARAAATRQVSQGEEAGR